jgi:hypothetical protein
MRRLKPVSFPSPKKFRKLVRKTGFFPGRLIAIIAIDFPINGQLDDFADAALVPEGVSADLKDTRFRLVGADRKSQKVLVEVNADPTDVLSKMDKPDERTDAQK